MALSKLPALQFYPGDWKKDVGVQSLSFHDRGVWFEMLLLMHDSPVRGKLMLGTKAMTTEMLAKALHLPSAELEVTIDTLLLHGVTEREKRTGALINRRMLRDENYRASTRERVAKCRRKSQKTIVNGNADVTRDCNADVQGSSSSSSSSSSKPLSGKPEEASLHVKCRGLVHAYWQRFHPGDELAPWDGHAGKKLAAFLSANPRLTEAGFKRLLDCRAESDVNHSDPPVDWIPKLIKFSSGPLDHYGKPLRLPKPTTPQLRGVTLEEAMQR